MNNYSKKYSKSKIWERTLTVVMPDGTPSLPDEANGRHILASVRVHTTALSRSSGPVIKVYVEVYVC